MTTGSDLPRVDLVTRTLYDGGEVEVVEAVRVAGGPRLEVPEGSRVAVEHLAGASTPVVHVELLAARVRYVDRGTVAAEERAEPADLVELRSLVAHHRPTGSAPEGTDDLCVACSSRWPCPTARLLAEVDRRGRHVHELQLAALALQAELEGARARLPDGSLLDTECSLCHVPLSTRTCRHLLDLGDGRVVVPRAVWEDLVAQPTDHGVSLHHPDGCVDCLEVARAL